MAKETVSMLLTVRILFQGQPVVNQVPGGNGSEAISALGDRMNGAAPPDASRNHEEDGLYCDGGAEEVDDALRLAG